MGRKENDQVKELMANTAVVLVAPKYPENVGAAARTAINMGVGQLILVRREMPDQERMRKMATHNAAALIDSLVRCDTLAEALAPFGWVIGTSARQGRKRSTIGSPRHIVTDLAPKLQNNRVALVFGPEDRGLTNDDLKYCNQVTTIPTVDFSSLNLAQAVAILCHELHYGLHEALSKGAPLFAPKLAESNELEAMYGHVEEVLRQIGFLKGTDYDYWMKSIRQFLGRIGLKSKEARTIRGFCHQFLWYVNQEGKKEKAPDEASGAF